MQKIILDTNFLMIPFSLKVDIFSELDRIIDDKFEVYVLDKSLDELRKIIDEQKGKHRDAAKFGLEFTKTKGIKVVKTEGNVDDSLVELCSEYIIATQDAELKKKIKEKGGRLVILRQKSHLNLI